MGYLFGILPLFYLLFIISFMVFIILSIRQYIDLKKEQNDLLRELVDRLGRRGL